MSDFPTTSHPIPTPVVNPEGEPSDQSAVIESNLERLLDEAAKVAADNGVDFEAMVNKYVQNKHNIPPPPRPVPQIIPGRALPGSPAPTLRAPMIKPEQAMS